jgi:hypothetical protein
MKRGLQQSKRFDFRPGTVRRGGEIWGGDRGGCAGLRSLSTDRTPAERGLGDGCFVMSGLQRDNHYKKTRTVFIGPRASRGPMSDLSTQ